jgi:hypothetical protein
MRPILPLFAIFALAACGQSDRPPPKAKTGKAKVQAGQPAVPETEAQEQAREQGRDAAAVLRRYYDHIEAGRYDDAWAMRGGKTEGKEAFSRNFLAYEQYRVTVGRATDPVTGGGWTFVEVPIQIFGRMKGGEPFGSAGSVTLRRASGAPGATAAQKNWHIYTGD